MRISWLGLAAATLLPVEAGLCLAQPAYHLETVAGGGRTDSGPPSAALSGDILGIAIDRWGNLYFADTDHHRVCRLTPGGILATVAGTGYQGFEGDGGPATAATLNFPYGVAVDTQGRLYIADLGNDRVRRVGLDGLIITVAGAGQAGFQGDGGKATDARLLSPRNVLVDAAGNLYFSEFKGHRVRRVGPDGSITAIAGTGVAGFRGDGGLAAAAQLAYPAGLALDPAGSLYIADSQNRCVRKVAPGGVISTVLGGGPADPLPTAVAADAFGNLYVADQGPTIRKLLPGGLPATAATLYKAHDLTIDATGTLYAADGHQIRRVTPAGQVLSVLGDQPVPFSAEAAAAALAVLDHPAGVAVDAQGNLYLSEGNRIRKVTPQGSLTTVAGIGTGGFGGDGGPPAMALLSGPAGLAVDSAGNLLVADTGNHRIRQVQPAASIRTLIGTGTPPSPLNAPRGVAADRAGNVYLADTSNHRVLLVSPAGLVTVLAGNGLAGSAGDGGPAILAQLNAPAAIALDAAGNLYIADTGNHRVRKVDPAGIMHTIAGTGAGDDHLQSPAGVAAGGLGNVLVADSGNHRIRAILPDGSILTVAGSGSPGFSGDGGAALSGQLNNPVSLALDNAGNVLVADSGNGRVRRLILDAQAPAAVTAPDPPVADAKIISAASLRAGPIAPGEILSIFASGIGPDRGVSGQLNSAGMLDTTLADAQVLFDGIPAPLFYVQANQINVQAPYSIAGQGSAQLEVQYQKVTRARARVSVADAAPGILTVSGGTGQALALNEDSQPNAAFNPAGRGSVIVLFGTGEGQAKPPAFSLRVGGTPAEILFAGSAPGFLGLFQINARVPSGFVPSGSLTVELTVGNVTSQPGVTIAVK